MTRWTDHNDTERMVMLQQAADAEGLPEYAVEKDWWVTMVLKAMFQTSVANAHSGYMPSRVKVEVSCLSMDEPFEVKEFGTMISSVFPDDDEDAMVSIPTVLPSRTFLEKAFLLCEEFQKPQPRSLRMSRHLYDLERLMDTEFGKAALEDDELYGKIVEHRRKFYHVGYADYDKDYRERISFLPPESCIEAWRADYDELLMHFVYGNKLSFDELLERVSELNKRFNGEDYK